MTLLKLGLTKHNTFGCSSKYPGGSGLSTQSVNPRDVTHDPSYGKSSCLRTKVGIGVEVLRYLIGSTNPDEIT